MVLGLGGSGVRGVKDLADKGVSTEAADYNCGVHCREANLRSVYR